MRIILLVISLNIVTFADARAEWVKIGEGSDARDLGVFVESESIRRSGNYAKMWDLTNYKTPQIVSGKRYLSDKLLQEYDCKNEMTRILFISSHSGSMGSGEIVKFVNIAIGTEWQPNVPGSINEQKWKIVCN